MAENKLNMAETDPERRRGYSEDYNAPGHYRISRKEFGHGQSGNMVPDNTEEYSRQIAGRDFEQNAGYRENYDQLDIGPGTGYEDTVWRNAEQERFINRNSRRGKGPRSYQRPDERILEDINDRLYDDPDIDASDIEVQVDKGDVILSGTVEDRKSKRAAEDVAESVSGVKNVENRLRINQNATSVSTRN